MGRKSRGAWAITALLVWMAAACAAAAPAAPAQGNDTDATLDRCFALQRSDPAAAASLAEVVLRDTSLPADQTIKALSCLGVASSMAGNDARAIAAAERMQQLLEQHPMAPGFTLRALSNAGAIFQGSGQSYRALELYVRAYAQASGGNVPLIQFTTLINIASIYSTELGDYATAEAYFRRAEALRPATDTRDPLLDYNRSLNFIAMGRDDDAMKALERGLAASQKPDNTLLHERMAAERAGILGRSGKPAQARALLQQILLRQRALPDAPGESATLTQLSAVQLAEGNAQAALASAAAAEQLVPGAGARDERKRALQARLAADRALGDFKAALAVATELHAAEIAPLRAWNLHAMATLQAHLEDTEKAHKLEQLQHSEQLQALTLANARLRRDWAMIALVLVLGTGALLVSMQRRANRRLRRLNRLDSLTGLLNRRAGAERLDQWLARTPRDGAQQTVVFLLDMDHFKAINDRHGHEAGDRVLMAASARMRAFCRPQDIVARWGGEEFLLACPGLDQGEAGRFATQLCALMADTPIPLTAQTTVSLTISAGFAPHPFHALDGKTWQQSVRLADRALYAAKRSGRDGWVGLWGSETPALAVEDILKDPAQAAARGAIQITSSSPTSWPDAENQA